jgi:hypothetical protein
MNEIPNKAYCSQVKLTFFENAVVGMRPSFLKHLYVRHLSLRVGIVFSQDRSEQDGSSVRRQLAAEGLILEERRAC